MSEEFIDFFLKKVGIDPKKITDISISHEPSKKCCKKCQDADIDCGDWCECHQFCIDIVQEESK